MIQLRPIEPIEIEGLSPAIPPTGEPICERANPRSLFVDPAYQRSISERGLRQIRRIIQGYCWTKFKPPICAYATDRDGKTVLMVLDGQHTAIAAASNPNIDVIPVMIVEAPETSAQASAFVGQNTERVGITQLQLHKAAVVAGDEDALDIENVCARAGVTVLTVAPATSRFRPRETIAVATIRGLVTRHTAMGARRILEVLANADFAPIAAHHIKATELLMTGPDFCQQFEPEDLTKAMVELYLQAEDEAKLLAHAQRIPIWKALAIVWYRKTKKRRSLIRVVSRR
ncbi:MAG: hypothetical protein EPN45_13775 [Rhizobiaceae bacterium]|nr:MAG: hypothetical protein EPN45_13775 [Rhizobiaceae bacterium]